jgi:hypothetical protein
MWGVFALLSSALSTGPARVPVFAHSAFFHLVCPLLPTCVCVCLCACWACLLSCVCTCVCASACLQDLAKTIERAGKSINFLRDACEDKQWVHDWAPAAAQAAAALGYGQVCVCTRCLCRIVALSSRLGVWHSCSICFLAPQHLPGL